MATKAASRVAINGRVVEHYLLMTPVFRRFRAQGGTLAPILFVVVALALSAAVFFLFTKKRMDAARESEQQQQATAKVNEDGTTSPPPAIATPDSPTPPAGKAPALPPSAVPKLPSAATSLAPFGFARPGDVAEQFTRSLGAGDLAAAAKLISAGDPAQEAAALRALENMKALGYKPGKPEEVQVVGQVEGAMRLSIPLLKADGTSAGTRLQLDVEKDSKMGWKIGTLRLPKELESIIAAAPMPAAPPTVNPGGGAPLPAMGPKPLFVVESASAPDPINFASDFLRALLKLDYETARKYVDEEKVPPVKLAGLCIVFEDGKYELQESKPLYATVSTPQLCWVIANVKSAHRDEVTEFSIEMENQNGNWRVMRLNLSKLLADNAKATSAVGIPYTPLVQNPRGGESVALYYEYDSAVLHPRAQAQLKIVAEVLKSSPSKKLKITGHTDALGSDSYNIALSQRRAEAVKKFFLEQGLPAAQVETIGFGKAAPLSPNANPDGSDNPEGRSQNRRAEILLDF